MAAMPAATIYPQSHVGFDSITSQIERKLLKRGFQFNVICVGQLKFFVYLKRTSRNDLEHWFTDMSGPNRPNWVGKIDPDQHHLRLPPH